jgi:hypothetical protein
MAQPSTPERTADKHRRRGHTKLQTPQSVPAVAPPSAACKPSCHRWYDGCVKKENYYSFSRNVREEFRKTAVCGHQLASKRSSARVRPRPCARSLSHIAHRVRKICGAAHVRASLRSPWSAQAGVKRLTIANSCNGFVCWSLILARGASLHHHRRFSQLQPSLCGWYSPAASAVVAAVTSAQSRHDQRLALWPRVCDAHLLFCRAHTTHVREHTTETLTQRAPPPERRQACQGDAWPRHACHVGPSGHGRGAI